MTTMLRKFLRPGEFYTGREPVVAETLVGSCVAVCLYNYKQGFGAMNHFLMDRPKNPAETDIGRYGVTSTRHIVDAMMQIDPEPTHYRATILGGAAVLKTAHEDGRIGQGNVAAALEVLHAAHIRVAGREVGGTRGRRIRFNTQTGEIQCRFAGDIPGRKAVP
ncbi:MAG TPA: chemotaxis protein CheD [Sedimentisphaerales bacterium]|jgi:chemotaxis protein CheD|nr:chemotaxis protein CheD [Sedimentisphaerales bacterium]HNU31654.1 chemotaxis protein CheD [Sedimentisphaerales bacterium]